MKILRKNFSLLFLACVLFVSCASRKDLIYLQDVGTSSQIDQDAKYEPTLKPDDLLSIIISAETPEVTVPFNLPAIQGNYEVGNNQNGIKTYLIDNTGHIDFPVIGKIQLGGLTRAEAINKISLSVSEYIKDPSINLRILNYKVSVLGEVAKPGTYTISSERITLLEALGMAGDLTIYGQRSNILVIREADGKKSFNRIDITNKNFIASPFYYLTQNDVVVVDPNKAKMNASVIGPNIPLILSALSLAATFLIILTR